MVLIVLITVWNWSKNGMFEFYKRTNWYFTESDCSFWICKLRMLIHIIYLDDHSYAQLLLRTTSFKDLRRLRSIQSAET